MTGYQTDPAELAAAAKKLEATADEVAAGLSEIAGGASSSLGSGGLDAAADAVLHEQSELVTGIRDDLSASATAAAEVSRRYLRLEEDVREEIRHAEGVADDE